MLLLNVHKFRIDKQLYMSTQFLVRQLRAIGELSEADRFTCIKWQQNTHQESPHCYIVCTLQVIQFHFTWNSRQTKITNLKNIACFFNIALCFLKIYIHNINVFKIFIKLCKQKCRAQIIIYFSCYVVYLLTKNIINKYAN